MNRNLIPEKGKVYGKLTVTGLSKLRCEHRSRFWNCRCECGKNRRVEGNKLRKGLVKSCGCDNRQGSVAVDLIGNRYGRLTVVSRGTKATNSKTPLPFWNCLCDCGKECVVRGDVLRNGMSKSCGCLRRELMRSRMAASKGVRRGPYKKSIRSPQNTEKVASSMRRSGKDHVALILVHPGLREYKGAIVSIDKLQVVFRHKKERSKYVVETSFLKGDVVRMTIPPKGEATLVVRSNDAVALAVDSDSFKLTDSGFYEVVDLNGNTHYLEAKHTRAQTTLFSLTERTNDEKVTSVPDEVDEAAPGQRLRRKTVSKGARPS